MSAVGNSSSTYRSQTRDQITGLLNPGAFMAVLDYALARAERAQLPTTVLFAWIPIPSFELEGDERLFTLVSRYLRMGVRGEDCLGRMGNSFLVLLADTDLQTSQVVVQRLRSALWVNEGLASAGRWNVEASEATLADDGRSLLERASAPIPGLARATLPKERRNHKIGRRKLSRDS